MFFSNIIYNLNLSAIVFIFGLGLFVLFDVKLSLKDFLYRFVRIFLGSFLLTFFICFVFNHLFKSFWFFQLIVFISVSISILFVLLLSLTRIKFFRFDLYDFCLILLFSLFSLSESNSFTSCSSVLITIVVSYFILISILNFIKYQIKYQKNRFDFEKRAFVFIIISILILLFYIWNVSWLNNEVFE